MRLQDTNFLGSAWMFQNISSNRTLHVSCILKTFNNISNPDYASVMQEKGCSGIVRQVMDVVSVFFLAWFFKLLFETQPDCVS